jgi:pimeloyl-ACP methyl ester carboxylesterase
MPDRPHACPAPTQRSPLVRRLVRHAAPAAALVCATLLAAGCAGRRGGMAAAPAPAAEEWDYVADDGVRHYVTEFGTGDTVVVLHGGWGGEHSGLVDAVRPLAGRFHFVLYDQRGSLRSPAPDSTVSLPRLVRDLDGLRRQLGQERLTLFAHSMGTVLAYAYLAEHPDRVRGLVLTAPLLTPLLPPGSQLRFLGAPAGDSARLARLRRDLDSAQAARRAATLAAAGLDRADTTRLTDRERSVRWRVGLASRMLARPERWRAMGGGPSYYNPRVGEAIARNTPAAARDSLYDRFLPALAAFAGPVTLVIGDADFVDPGAARWRYAVAGRLPRARLAVVPGAGHLAWRDEPARFAAAAGDALARAVGR